MKKKINEEQIKEIKKIFEINPRFSIKNIALKYNVCKDTIFNLLKENNIKYVNSFDWTRKYSFDETFFEKIDSEEKAYFLGFLYADGCVSKQNSINLGLNTEDKEIIESFKAALKSNHPIRDLEVEINYGEKYGKKINKKSLLRIGSKKMAADLEKLGCFKQKTFKLRFPTEDQVPNHLIHHFIRGYFDGDGSVYQVKNKHKDKIYYSFNISFTSTSDMIDGLINHFTKNGCSGIEKGKHPQSGEKGIFILKARRNNDVLAIKNYIYNKANIFLRRKYNKFLDGELKYIHHNSDIIQPFIRSNFKNSIFTTLDIKKYSMFPLQEIQKNVNILIEKDEIEIIKNQGRLRFFKFKNV